MDFVHKNRQQQNARKKGVSCVTAARQAGWVWLDYHANTNVLASPCISADTTISHFTQKSINAQVESNVSAQPFLLNFNPNVESSKTQSCSLPTSFISVFTCLITLCRLSCQQDMTQNTINLLKFWIWQRVNKNNIAGSQNSSQIEPGWKPQFSTSVPFSQMPTQHARTQHRFATWTKHHCLQNKEGARWIRLLNMLELIRTQSIKTLFVQANFSPPTEVGNYLNLKCPYCVSSCDFNCWIFCVNTYSSKSVPWMLQ